MSEPTIYKPCIYNEKGVYNGDSVYNGNGIYKNGSVSPLSEILALSYYQELSPNIFKFEIGDLSVNSSLFYIGNDTHNFKSFNNLKCGKFKLNGNQYGIYNKTFEEDFLSFEVFIDGVSNTSSWAAMEFSGFGSFFYMSPSHPACGQVVFGWGFGTSGRNGVELFNGWDWADSSNSIITKSGTSCQDVFISALYDKGENKVYYYVDGNLVATKSAAADIFRFSVEGSNNDYTYMTQLSLFRMDKTENGRNNYPLPTEIYR